MPTALRFCFRPLCLLAATLLASPQLLARTSADAAPAQLQLSADGSEVHDLRARLAWPRCLQGMEWRKQRCEGRPQRLSFGQAKELAQSLHQADGLRWRLPRANELRRLRQHAALAGEQAALLPDVPGGWHWTGTAAVNAAPVNQYSYEQTGPGKSRLSAQQAWAVDWATGKASGEMGRGNTLLVRLVRPLAAP
ncbi:DUF1566 domain-containing protein [Pantoea sp. 18069]|uniref:Lcl domain-containing protein n=1 Tax=Pantoea sp. 18069 TaxID=2681415 RepID=UPI0013575001|nr:DUF1566 domain-containing protein [Pantoea sp. 18069]